MNKILFTIIIPVCNGEKTIENAIESVYSQTYAKWELLIIENSSIDNTSLIVKKHVNQRIRLLESETGVSCARNKGINEARGEYILFLDADDVLPKETLSIYKEILKEKDEDVIFGKYTYEKIDNSIEQIKNKEEYVCQCLNDPTVKLNIHGCLFKKSIIDKFSLSFNEELKYAEDSLFVLDFILKSKNIVVISYHTYRYTYSDNSTIRRNNINQFDLYILTIKEIYKLDFTNKEKQELNTFVLNQLLIVFVNNVFNNNDYKFIEQISKEKELIDREEINKCLENLTYLYCDRKRKLMFNLMKKRRYFLIGVICKLKSIKNKGKNK